MKVIISPFTIFERYCLLGKKGLSLVFSHSLLIVKRMAFMAGLVFSSLWFEIHVNLSKSSFSFFQPMPILLIICFIFDQDQFNASDNKPMLTIIITTLVMHSACRCNVDFLHYQFKEKLRLLVFTHRRLVVQSI